MLDQELAKQTYNTIVSLDDTEYMAFSQLGIIYFLSKIYSNNIIKESISLGKFFY